MGIFLDRELVYTNQKTMILKRNYHLINYHILINFETSYHQGICIIYTNK